MFLTNHDSQWGRSEVVIIYPDLYANGCASLQILYNRFDTSLYFFMFPKYDPQVHDMSNAFSIFSYLVPYYS